MCLLRKVFEWLQESGLKLIKTKCIFKEKELKFPRNRIEEKGLHLLQDKCQCHTGGTGANLSEPVKFFPWLNQVLTKFLPNFSTMLAPLYATLTKGVAWKWGQVQESVIQKEKRL